MLNCETGCGVIRDLKSQIETLNRELDFANDALANAENENNSLKATVVAQSQLLAGYFFENERLRGRKHSTRNKV